MSDTQAEFCFWMFCAAASGCLASSPTACFRLLGANVVKPKLSQFQVNLFRILGVLNVAGSLYRLLILSKR